MAGGPTRPAPPLRAPFRPSASCDAPPRKSGPPAWQPDVFTRGYQRVRTGDGAAPGPCRCRLASRRSGRRIGVICRFARATSDSVCPGNGCCAGRKRPLNTRFVGDRCNGPRGGAVTGRLAGRAGAARCRGRAEGIQWPGRDRPSRRYDRRKRALPYWGDQPVSVPPPDRFVGHRDAALGQEIFDIAKAHSEAVIQPDGVADDFGRESISLVAQRVAFHRPSLPRSH